GRGDEHLAAPEPLAGARVVQDASRPARLARRHAHSRPTSFCTPYCLFFAGANFLRWRCARAVLGLNGDHVGNALAKPFVTLLLAILDKEARPRAGPFAP